MLRRIAFSSAIAFSCIRLLLAALLTVTAAAQTTDNISDRLTYVPTYTTAPGTAVILVHVFADRTTSQLNRQAVLKLASRATQDVWWATTDGKAQGVFTNLIFGAYDVEVSAVGYLSAHQELQVRDSGHPIEIDVVLQPDPQAVNLDVGGVGALAKSAEGN